MIAMTVASILLIGLTAGYSALSRASSRLAIAQAGLVDRAEPQCRTPTEQAKVDRRPRPRDRCDLPEICEYDTVSQSCRTTTSPSA